MSVLENRLPPPETYIEIPRKKISFTKQQIDMLPPGQIFFMKEGTIIEYNGCDIEFNGKCWEFEGNSFLNLRKAADYVDQCIKETKPKDPHILAAII